MAKMIDITDKLTFGENPRLRIKDEELEVHADTATVLQIMELLGDEDTGTRSSAALTCCWARSLGRSWRR